MVLKGKAPYDVFASLTHLKRLTLHSHYYIVIAGIFKIPPQQTNHRPWSKFNKILTGSSESVVVCLYTLYHCRSVNVHSFRSVSNEQRGEHFSDCSTNSHSTMYYILLPSLFNADWTKLNSIHGFTVVKGVVFQWGTI